MDKSILYTTLFDIFCNFPHNLAVKVADSCDSGYEGEHNVVGFVEISLPYFLMQVDAYLKSIARARAYICQFFSRGGNKLPYVIKLFDIAHLSLLSA